MNVKMKRILIIFSICLNAGFIALAAYALVVHEPRSSRYRHPGIRHMKVFDELNLSPEQKAEIENLENAFVEKMKGMRERALREKLALSPLLESDNVPGLADLEPYLARQKEIEVEKEDLVFRHMYQIRTILTPEQARLFFGSLSERIRKKLP